MTLIIVISIAFIEIYSINPFYNVKLNKSQQEISNKILLDYKDTSKESKLLKEKIDFLIADGTFDSVYKEYRFKYKDFLDEEIFEMVKKNLLGKVLINDSENFEENLLSIRISKPINQNQEIEDDKFESVFLFIKDNLSPDYEVSLDTGEKNVKILKDNLGKVPLELKNIVDIYILDTEASLKFEKENPELVKKYAPGSEKIMTRSEYLEFKNSSFFGRTSTEQKNAINYANKYYKEFNPIFPNWEGEGGDCANFVSQCLYAGDKQMRNYDGDVTNSRNWFSYGNIADASKVSSTFRGANMFRWHWGSRAYEFKDFYMSDPKAVKAIYEYAELAFPVSIFNVGSNTAYHTMIVNGFSFWSKDVSFAQHSSSSNNRKASSIPNDKILRIYKVYP